MASWCAWPAAMPTPSASRSAGAGPGRRDGDDVRELVWQTLKTCYDPEIPVDIVELGLVYAATCCPVDDERCASSSR
jgi:hypothetical protein